MFGPTCTSINSSITPWLDKYIKLAEIPAGGYLFHAPGDKLKAVAKSMWTERIKATLRGIW